LVSDDFYARKIPNETHRSDDLLLVTPEQEQWFPLRLWGSLSDHGLVSVLVSSAIVTDKTI